MNRKAHEVVACCGLGERPSAELREPLLPFEPRFERLPEPSSSLAPELCCPVAQSPAKCPRWRVVPEASCSTSFAGERSCLRASLVAASALDLSGAGRFGLGGNRSALLSRSGMLSSLLGNSLQSRSVSGLVAEASLSGRVVRATSVAPRKSRGGWGSRSLRSVLLVFERRAQDRSWPAERRPRAGRRKISGNQVQLGRVTRHLKRTPELSSAVVPCGRSWLRGAMEACLGAA